MSNYRAFARDLMKLCKKHGIKLSACNEGMVLLGPANAKKVGDYPFSMIVCSPTQVKVGDHDENGAFEMKAGEED